MKPIEQQRDGLKDEDRVFKFRSHLSISSEVIR